MSPILSTANSLFLRSASQLLVRTRRTWPVNLVKLFGPSRPPAHPQEDLAFGAHELCTSLQEEKERLGLTSSASCIPGEAAKIQASTPSLARAERR